MSTPIQASTSTTSTSNLEDLLRTSSQEENEATGSPSFSSKAYHQQILEKANLEHHIDEQAKLSIQEMHQDRMFVLREQMKFLNETEWRYKPIDVLIGCLTVNTRFP